MAKSETERDQHPAQSSSPAPLPEFPASEHDWHSDQYDAKIKRKHSIAGDDTDGILGKKARGQISKDKIGGREYNGDIDGDLEAFWKSEADDEEEKSIPPSISSSDTLGRSQLSSSSPPYRISSSTDSHKLGGTESEYASYYTISRSELSSSSQTTSQPPSSSPDSHTIGRTESESMSSPSSTVKSKDPDTDGSESSDDDGDLFTQSYRQGITYARERSMSSNLSPKSLPRRFSSENMHAPSNFHLKDNNETTGKLQNLSHRINVNADAKDQGMDIKEDNEEIEDEGSDYQGNIDLEPVDMESEEDPDDPEDWALSHWNELEDPEDDEKMSKSYSAWTGHGMVTRAKAGRVYGDAMKGNVLARS